MRRWRKYDIYIVAFLLVLTVGCFIYNHHSSEARGVSEYSTALKAYKDNDFEKAYQEFGKVPQDSSLKHPALFRQARCATNLGRTENAIKKYKKIVNTNSESAIAPISEYNMAVLMFESQDKRAKHHFKKIIKKYPTSDYAIASNYYLGMIEAINPPKNKKRLEKSKERALEYFKNYIDKAPDGRFAINSVKAIKNLDKTLSNYDNLLIAKAYYANGEYDNALAFLQATTVSESWSDFAKTEYRLGDKAKGNYYAELGLTKHASTTEPADVYEVIDNYITASATRKDGINKLLSLRLKSTGADYVSYLYCSEVADSASKSDCFKAMYEKYPNGQFSAEALYNLFLAKYLQKKYYDAQRLGFLHMRKFQNVKSSPAVTYFMAKIAFKLKHYESANSYFKEVITKYPDSYYAFRANYNLYKDDGFLPFLALKEKPVIFPYRKSLDNNLVVKLAYLKDYDFVEELCKKDKFIQSWISYEKGDYTVSAVLARNAMEEQSVKPPFDDLRWRLIYPLHYYDSVNRYKGNNNPIILQSIIKEESHFNPYAESSVGAKGLMQLMPSTYSEVLSKNNIPSSLSIADKNIAAGSLYYSGLKKSLVNKDLYAISAYNGGIGSVTNWFSKIIYNDTDEFVEQIPYPETKNYVKKVLRTYWVYGNIY